jgi:hypothetical protein
VLPGLVGGVAFLAVVVFGGALVHRPWALPDAVAAVLGVHTRGYPARLVPALTGVGTHLAVSVILGVLYLAIARRLRLRGWWLVFGGWLFSGVETPVSLWGILHTVVSHATFGYFLDAVPFWVSFLGHTVYGLALGGLAVLVMRR